jgi:NAD(P)-dependent dehydrogenase (short-subunit alcohol dehydrogenase family)
MHAHCNIQLHMHKHHSLMARALRVSQVPVYAATKGGALSLTRQLAMEYGPHGIRVLAVNPGTIRTPLVADLLPGGGTDEDWAAAGAVYPLQSRVGEIHEVGAVCAFLASPGASYMTGCAVDVDGGIMAKGGWNT